MEFMMKNGFRQYATKRLLLGTLVGLAVVGSLSACGSHHMHRSSEKMSTEQVVKMRDKMVERVSSRLDLNADQKAKLVTLADLMQKQRANLMGQVDPRTELAAILAGPKFDRTKAQNLINEKTSTISAQSPATVTAMADFYDSLNPEQQTKVRAFLQHRKGRHH
jgi:periplasmic protein CpxP/Spy